MQSVVNFDVEVSDAVEQHIIRVEDEEDANLLDHLEDAVDFIDDAIGSNKKVLPLEQYAILLWSCACKRCAVVQVLVHCQAGMSRSAAVVLAYMCFSMGTSVEESLQVLKVTSPQACPNAGFMYQVALFSTMGCGHNTATTPGQSRLDCTIITLFTAGIVDKGQACHEMTFTYQPRGVHNHCNGTTAPSRIYLS